MAVAVQSSAGEAHAFKITDNGPLVGSLLASSPTPGTRLVHY